MGPGSSLTDVDDGRQGGAPGAEAQQQDEHGEGAAGRRGAAEADTVAEAVGETRARAGAGTGARAWGPHNTPTIRLKSEKPITTLFTRQGKKYTLRPPPLTFLSITH